MLSQLLSKNMLDYKFSDKTLSQKVILVTGAGDGIGKQAALAYASAGATVILLGKTISKLEQVYDLVVDSGGPQPATQLDSTHCQTASHPSQVSAQSDAGTESPAS